MATKTERIEIRTDLDSAARTAQAAQARNTSISAFVLDAATAARSRHACSPICIATGSAYTPISPPTSGVLHHVNPIGPDMGLVVLTSPEHIGPVTAGVAIPAHRFITRLIGDMWVISANAARLPEPDWPPTEGA